MYFIEDGNISIRIKQDVGDVEVALLGKGQYFGELALVTHRPRAASAYAADNIKVACKSLILFYLTTILYLILKQIVVFSNLCDSFVFSFFFFVFYKKKSYFYFLQLLII